MTLREEFKAELARAEKTHAEKELALLTELESLKGASAEPNIGGMELKVRKNSPTGALDAKAARQESTKEKGEEKTNVEFIRKELEKCKKRSAEVMKENSKLCNQIAELTIQNETLRKTVANQSRKANDFKQPTGMLGTPKFVSLNAKRQDWKRRAHPNQLRIDPSQESHGQCNRSLIVPSSISEPVSAGACAPSAPSTKDIGAEIEAIERGRKTLSSGDPVEIAPPETEDTGSNKSSPHSAKESASGEDTKQTFAPLRTTVCQTYATAAPPATISGLRGTAVRLALCKAVPRPQNKYALADEAHGVGGTIRRPTTSAGVRSKSPTDFRIAGEAGKSKMASVVVPETGRQSMVPLNVPLTPAGSGSSGSCFAVQAQEAPEPSRWKCVSNEEYHTLGIFSLASFDQYLISSSNAVKMWDINKKAIATEIPNTVSKCLYVDVQRKLLIGNTEQTGTVTFWSLPDLASVATIETGMKIVRALYVDKHILFVGGCSSGSGALQLWDINTMTKLCERERSQDSDIFSIFKRGPVVFYGGRNRCINRLDLDSLVRNEKVSYAILGRTARTESGTLRCSQCFDQSGGHAHQWLQGILVPNVGLRHGEGAVPGGQVHDHAQRGPKYVHT